MQQLGTNIFSETRDDDEGVPNFVEGRDGTKAEQQLVGKMSATPSEVRIGVPI